MQNHYTREDPRERLLTPAEGSSPHFATEGPYPGFPTHNPEHFPPPSTSSRRAHRSGIFTTIDTQSHVGAVSDVPSLIYSPSTASESSFVGGPSPIRQFYTPQHHSVPEESMALDDLSCPFWYYCGHGSHMSVDEQHVVDVVHALSSILCPSQSRGGQLDCIVSGCAENLLGMAADNLITHFLGHCWENQHESANGWVDRGKAWQVMNRCQKRGLVTPEAFRQFKGRFSMEDGTTMGAAIVHFNDAAGHNERFGRRYR